MIEEIIRNREAFEKEVFTLKDVQDISQKVFILMFELFSAPPSFELPLKQAALLPKHSVQTCN